MPELIKSILKYISTLSINTLSLDMRLGTENQWLFVVDHSSTCIYFPSINAVY